MSESLQNAKKKRTPHRTRATNLMLKIEGSLKEEKTSVDQLFEFLEQLKAIDCTLKELNNEIENGLDDEELEKDIMASAEYEEKIISFKIKLNRRIEQLQNSNAHISSSVTVFPANEIIRNIPEVKTVKLPKLVINKYFGDPDKYLEFWNQFENAIHKNSSLSAIDKFNYLKTLLGGTAANAISGFSLTEANYTAAISLFKERFGNHEILVHAHLNNLLNITAVKSSSDIRGLRNLYDRCETQIRSLEALDISEDTYSSLLCSILLKLLPVKMTIDFTRIQQQNKNWNVKTLTSFIKSEIQSLEQAFAIHNISVSQPVPHKNDKFSDRNKCSDNFNTARTNYAPKFKSHAKSNISSATELVSSVHDNLCIFCNNEHNSETCVSVPVNQKKEVLKNQGRCYLCLQQKHRIRECKRKDFCSYCSGKHNATLCYKKEKCILNSESSKTDNIENSVSNHVSNEKNKILLQTGTIEAIGDESSKRVIRFLFDSGSQRSFVLKAVSKELKLRPLSTEEIVIHTFGSKAPMRKICTRVEVKVKGPCGNEFTIEALEVEQISTAGLDSPNQNIYRELKERGIILADIWKESSTGSNQISLLIGADNYWNLVTGKIERLNSTLVAIESKLGWFLMGKINSGKNENCAENESIGSSVFTAMFSSIHDSNIESLWKLDTLGICDPVETKSRSEIELATLKHFKETVTVDEDGRYEIHLPWINDREILNTNLDIVKQRFICTTEKLVRKGKFEEYEKVFEEWFKEGIIEEVPVEELTNTCHYLPHRGVFKENSTTKLRPVFDASCRGKDSLSLNDCLEKGPNLLEQIPPILRRFRKDRVGVISDIRKAFLQISVAKTDREFLRFLLWEDFEERRFRVLRHKRVVFGLTCSPFLLAAVLNHHLEINSSNFPETAELLRKSFYVDNCVTSVSDEDALRQFIEESTQLLASAGFDLRGWEHSTLDVEKIPTEVIPVLGLLWDRDADALFCDTKNIKPWSSDITRRNVLSTVHKIFDPLGILCPTTLIPKLIVQKSWNLKIGWDIALPEELQKEFLSWTHDLHLLTEVKIPRCLNICKEGEVSLHTFCDASKLAYSAVVFLRSVDESNNITVQFVEARSRVAPVRKVTIPRLELLACCIGARLASAVIHSLNLEDVPTHYWTDSSTTLFWIQKEDQWGVFVGNRVKEIRMLSPKDKWRHVPGSLNAADMPSRGCSITTLLNSRWWEGPEWLRKKEEEWPNSKVIVNEEEIAREKRKGLVSTVASAIVEDQWYLKYFSSYSRIIRMIAWILRFAKNCQSKDENVQGELSVQEIEAAEKKLLRIVQTESLCSDKKQKDLFTFVDESGLVRLKTKIIRRDDDENFRCPIVLPSKHELVDRLIFDCHLQCSHAGVQVVLTNLRQKFWILRGRKTVQRVLSKCIRCKRHTAKGLETIPAPLPEDRIRDALAFEVTGVDFAGPLHLKAQKKAWIVIFTCAVYRAVHLELVESLSTNAFLLGLRRFIARRGRPNIIYSDNGSNFVGTQRLLKSLDWDTILKDTSIRKIQWKFNPPTAAWWGGWWERLIQMVKKILRRVLGRTCLSFEEMSTILCDAEAVINSRPLTYLSEDPDDLAPLTPSMFIQDVKTVGVPDLDNLDKINLTKRWKYHQRLRVQFRKRFRDEYLGVLVQRPLKKSFSKPIQENDLVIVGCDNKKRIDWPMGRVTTIYPGKDNNVRVVKVKTSMGELTRPIQRIFSLELNHDSPLCGTIKRKGTPSND